MVLIDTTVAPNDSGKQLVGVSAMLTNLEKEAINRAYRNEYQELCQCSEKWETVDLAKCDD